MLHSDNHLSAESLMNKPMPEATSTNLSTPVDPKPNAPFVGPRGLRPFWALLLYLAILATPVMLFFVAAHLAHSGDPVAAKRAQIEHGIPPLTSLISEWLQFGFVFFATWIMSRIEHRSVFDYGLSPTPRRGRWMLIGAVLGLLFQSLLVLLLRSTHHLFFDGVLLRAAPALMYGAVWAVAFLGVAFFEEFLFRGYLQFNLTQCFAGLVRSVAPRSTQAEAIGFWAAAVLISFGFGLLHGSNPGESPIGLLCAGCAGLMFAFSLWRTGSLWWAIGLHFAWDWAQSFLFGVADSGAVSADRLLSSHPTGSLLLSGGTTGPEGSIFVLPVMALITLVAAFTLPRTGRSFPIDSPLEETHVVPEVNSAQA
jgi:uncharacterized protein